MAPRKSGNKNHFNARLVTDKKEQCAFCYRKVDDELLYGKLYAIGDIQCHYYCVLLSSCLVQKGKDVQGLFGFLYEDILLEVERCKKHKCSFCNQIGANLGCSIAQCRKQFHLPCGRERNAVSLFYGNYKSFCQNHAPKQKIPDAIMLKAKLRKSNDKKSKNVKDCYFKDLKELSGNNSPDMESDAESVCVICYERVDGYPTPNTFWPPCCARDAWFHRTCLQRMALSAGMHYLKCPLCNDKEKFYEAVISQGYYVPDRDAAWELEQNAFSEIYDRPMVCSAVECECPMGRSHDADNGAWCISPCMLCGSSGQHSACGDTRYVCAVCQPAAPTDLDELADCIQAVISQEQSERSRRRQGPVMPSRMSLRRTKLHTNRQIPSCSSSQTSVHNETEPLSSRNTASSREILNLKSPKKISKEKENKLSSPIKLQFSPYKYESNQKSPFKELHSNKLDSPTKLLEEGLKNKFGNEEILKKDNLIKELRNRFKKPQPLSVKKKIVNDILNGLFDDLILDDKQQTTKPWMSPIKCSENENDPDVIEIPQKSEIIDLTSQHDTSTTESTENTNPYMHTPKKLKTIDISTDSSLEISAQNETVNIDVFKLNDSQKTDLNNPLKNKKSVFKFSPCNKGSIENKNLDIDIESFKNQYLNEVSCGNINNNKNKIKKMLKKRKSDDKIVVELDSKKKKKRRSISIKNKNISVKIKWRTEQLKFKFNDVKSKKKIKKYKQYVLQYSPMKSANVGTLNIAQNSKTDIDKTPVKRKSIKQEKSPDNLVQTSIQKFFKVKSPLSE